MYKRRITDFLVQAILAAAEANIDGLDQLLDSVVSYADDTYNEVIVRERIQNNDKTAIALATCYVLDWDGCDVNYLADKFLEFARNAWWHPSVSEAANMLEDMADDDGWWGAEDFYRFYLLPRNGSIPDGYEENLEANIVKMFDKFFRAAAENALRSWDIEVVVEANAEDASTIVVLGTPPGGRTVFLIRGHLKAWNFKFSCLDDLASDLLKTREQIRRMAEYHTKLYGLVTCKGAPIDTLRVFHTEPESLQAYRQYAQENGVPQDGGHFDWSESAYTAGLFEINLQTLEVE